MTEHTFMLASASKLPLMGVSNFVIRRVEDNMPPLGMRLSKQWGCRDEDLTNWYGPVFMATVFGPVLVGIAVATAPIWVVAAMTFLANNPTIPAHAFWAVIKAIARKKNPVKAGAKAGINASAVALIEKWVKKFLKFL